MNEHAPEDPSSFNNFFGEFSEVPLEVYGTHGDVVVSSHIRLCRNIVDFPFPEVCSDDQRQSTARSVGQCVEKVNLHHQEEELLLLPAEQLEELERQFLIEFQAVIDAATSSKDIDTTGSQSFKSDADDFPFSEMEDDASESSDSSEDSSINVSGDATVFDLQPYSPDQPATVSLPDDVDVDVEFAGDAFEKWDIDKDLPEAVFRKRLLTSLENAQLPQAPSSDEQSLPTPAEFEHVKTAIVTNDEDHVRIHGMAAGLDLLTVWQKVDRVDDQLEQHLGYAFSPQWGYLTACPANAGTGMRASVVLHLPGLATLGRLDQVFRWLLRAGIAGRGLFGEDAWGDFYRISNQPTLGKTEQSLLNLVQSAVPTIVAYEREARRVLLQHYGPNIEQQVDNAFRALKLPVQRSDEELLSLVSSIRLGLALGLLDQSKIDHIRETFELKRLKQQLEFAVMLEQYGTATKCRDRIRQLEKRRHGH